MPKGKCRFTPELERKYPSFKKGRYAYEAECKVCLPGTFVSVLHKSSCDLEAHLEKIFLFAQVMLLLQQRVLMHSS